MGVWVRGRFRVAGGRARQALVGVVTVALFAVGIMLGWFDLVYLPSARRPRILPEILTPRLALRALQSDP